MEVLASRFAGRQGCGAAFSRAARTCTSFAVWPFHNGARSRIDQGGEGDSGVQRQPPVRGGATSFLVSRLRNRARCRGSFPAKGSKRKRHHLAHAWRPRKLTSGKPNTLLKWKCEWLMGKNEQPLSTTHPHRTHAKHTSTGMYPLRRRTLPLPPEPTGLHHGLRQVLQLPQGHRAGFPLEQHLVPVLRSTHRAQESHAAVIHGDPPCLHLLHALDEVRTAVFKPRDQVGVLLRDLALKMK